MWLRVLVGMACVVVIAAGGVWLWQQFGARPALTREVCLDELKPWVEQKRTGEFEGILLECRDSGLITLGDVGQFAS